LGDLRPKGEKEIRIVQKEKEKKKESVEQGRLKGDYELGT